MPEAATSPTLPIEPSSAARKSRRRRGPKKSKGSKSPPSSPANNSTSTTSTVNSADGKTSPAISPKKSQSSHSNAQSSHSNGNGRRRGGQRNNAAGDAPNNAGANEFADMDFSHLNFNEPPPAVVSELPNGYGVSIVGTRSASGEITTRMKYDRQLMLGLSHSPYALAHPEGYPTVAVEMEELIPVFPRRYIPREYMPPANAVPEPNPANGA